ncbi:MAG: hypothetical protein LQ340_004540 [Diploschistes diacapsis]|nr:MAG: hypothetical protein LQ340_004540 [Diploschistes diacapsis]
MSAILSADDLNDFISPGVACIKPVETLPAQQPTQNVYEVTTEEKVVAEAPPAQISLTDCLACSGCVTSAEAVLVSLQSHAEVLNALDAYPSISIEGIQTLREGASRDSDALRTNGIKEKPKIFVASVSPQVRASLAATYGTSEREAGWMIDQLLSGPGGLATGGKYGSSFSFVVDTNAMREVALVMGSEEVSNVLAPGQSMSVKKPVLASACPGWVCYAEKKDPHILPHLSRIKSPQALTGTLLKTVLSTRLGISPDQIWHLAVMPCFDKKLEASREELTDSSWRIESAPDVVRTPVRDVDCVITAREILMLADSRGISFPNLSKKSLEADLAKAFPDPKIAQFLFPSNDLRRKESAQKPEAGSSGGFLYQVLRTQQSMHPGSEIRSQRGRNADVVDYTIVRGDEVLFRASRCYGFKNIQNLVRKLRPAKTSRLGRKITSTHQNLGSKNGSSDYAYVEVMACPGGCTNGGGQIKLDDLGTLQGQKQDLSSQKDWLALVDEAYYSMEESQNNEGQKLEFREEDSGSINGVSVTRIKTVLRHWGDLTGLNPEGLIRTSFREVHSDVGKQDRSDTARVAEVAAMVAGAW